MTFLPAVTNDLLVARNRYRSPERIAQERYFVCSDDMAYRGTDCVCGEHEQDFDE